MKRFGFLLNFFVACSWGQQVDIVDFKSAYVKISFAPDSSRVNGIVNYRFEVLKPIDSIFLDAINMRFSEVSLDGDLVRYSNNGAQVWFKNHFEADKFYQLSFKYVAQPKKALYFIDWDTSSEPNVTNNNKQIWTQGQGKYTSNWLPSIDDMNDKIEFDLSINFEKDFEVVANGKLTSKQLNDSTAVWHYDMKHPMSSYLVALAIGKYHKKVEYSKSGIPLEMYYYPEDSLKVEPTYRYTKQMFDFLEEEIGVPYPWQNYKQVPVKDFLYAGMENTSCTIFSDAFVIDSVAFADKNYVNVNAHELAHQWFGNLVTETSGTHHWLQEGFATYYALLAERDVFGKDYYYWQLYEYAQELLEQDKAGGSTSLLDPKSSSTTFYKKGAWVLHLLREKVGDGVFKAAVKNYLKKHQFKNVETDDFIGEVEKASGKDLDGFVDKWLISKKLNYVEMEEQLERKSKYIRDYLSIDCELNCYKFIRKSKHEKLRIKMVTQSMHPPYKELKNIENLKVRQAIAQTNSNWLKGYKEDYETLLNDKSYITIEAALFNLWKNFPQERAKYLNQTKGIIGFNDKNVRILWLTLALLTDDFEPENQSKYLKELTDYTSPNYGFETRINAFQYLIQIQACNDKCKAHLQQATTHHNWRMVKFSKSLQSEIEQ
ncbi:M1 family metallopeptidase [Tamlana crocina]|uniref:Aminopeptidase N n=1 Tax=Tamlana crocina TaxID=393006 RepID=A0ABX1DAQ5_9FLAO|nr:M1 family metallopeptidase [Tamlana crocina]NJX15416.1 M1 family metallopeptidase [Tamlana crocina]